jgi:cytochrome c-type biogenesis protein CcmH/NrfG
VAAVTLGTLQEIKEIMAISSEQPQSTPSLHELRSALDHAERQVGRLDGTNIQEFLVQLDNIEQMWTEYDDPSTVSAEAARWQSLVQRITTNPQLLTRAAAQVGGLSKLRAQHPPATGLWWHVDKQVAGQRKQTWRRVGLIGGAAAVVVLAFWLISNFMSGNGTTTGTVDTSQQIDQLVEAQNWQEARSVVETARQTSPDDSNLLVWEAVLAEQLGDSERAQTSLSQAEEMFAGPPAAFWTLVGDLRLRAGNLEGAEEAGQQALALAPEDAEVTFLLGRVAEARGDMAQAVDYFERTVTLAEDSNPQLVVVVRMRMSGLLQAIDSLPDQEPTPDPTQSAPP